MQNQNLPLGNREGIRFNQFDDLANHEDLEYLFEVLASISDKNNHSAIMTGLSLVANPDFDKIEANNFEHYFYKPLPQSLEEHNKSSAWSLWQQGFENGLFIPEFHGREHLNVASWMRDLKQKNSLARIGFQHKFWGFRQKINQVSYQAAFDLEYPGDVNIQKEILFDGLQLFKKIHKRKASFFVPPNGPFNNSLKSVISKHNITFISSPKIQKEPLGNNRFKKHFCYLGKINKTNQIYLTRNAFFEPSNPRKTDWVASCLRDIDTAFKFNKPATISSHRVNYIGTKSKKNRDQGLSELKRLLRGISKNWPEVEFMSSSDLGKLIKK